MDDIKDLIDKHIIMTEEEYIRKKYYEKHCRCPECGSMRNSRTSICFVLDLENPEEYKDENGATCSDCGWCGTVHQLLGAFEDKDTKKELAKVLDQLEKDCILVDSDDGKEYLDIPMEYWKRIRRIIEME